MIIRFLQLNSHASDLWDHALRRKQSIKPDSPQRLPAGHYSPWKGRSDTLPSPLLLSNPIFLSWLQMQEKLSFHFRHVNIRYAMYIEPKKLGEVLHVVRATILQASWGANGSQLSSTPGLQYVPIVGSYHWDKMKLWHLRWLSEKPPLCWLTKT